MGNVNCRGTKKTAINYSFPWFLLFFVSVSECIFIPRQCARGQLRMQQGHWTRHTFKGDSPHRGAPCATSLIFCGFSLGAMDPGALIGQRKVYDKIVVAVFFHHFQPHFHHLQVHFGHLQVHLHHFQPHLHHLQVQEHPKEHPKERTGRKRPAGGCGAACGAGGLWG